MTTTPPLILGNVLLDDRGDAWGVYRLPTSSYPLLSASRKTQLMRELAALAQRANGDMTIWRVTRLAPDAIVDTPSQRTVECYVAIHLDTQVANGLMGKLLRSPRPVPLRFTLTAKAIEQIAQAERETRTHARSTIDARAATSRELAWLTTRLRTLGLCEPAIDTHDDHPALIALDTDTVIVEPTQLQRLQLHDAHVVEQKDHVEVHSTGGSVRHAMLLLGALPDGLEFPGQAELAFTPLEHADATCDLVIHARWTPNSAAIRSAARTIVDADNATSEQASTGRVTDSRLHTQLDTALDYKQYLESDQAPPMLSASITVVVAAQTEQQLDRACAELAARFAPLHVTRPAFLQHDLWQSAQEPKRRARGAAGQHLTVEQLAALMPHVTEAVGTNTGPIIGHIRGSKRPVRLDLTAASRLDRPPSILCVGTLGSGKTMTAQLIASHALASGMLVVDVDPKPDHRLDQLPELHGRATIIDLADTDQHQGLLDPLQIADTSLRDEIAAGFYADLIDATARQRAHLRTALAQLTAATLHPTSQQLIHTLGEMPNPDAREMAEQLQAWSHSGLARLALGDRPNHDDHPRALDLTSIRCRSLVLPDSTTPRSDYTEAERVSCAIMRLIVTYALRLALGDNTRPKLVMIDEAWVLLGSPDGRALIDRINRTGRSENASLLLATQQLGDAIHTAPLIGTHMVFGLETSDEAHRAAELLGTDPSDELIHALCSQRAGQAVMRDIHGRLARIQIDVPTDLLSTLATGPRGSA